MKELNDNDTDTSANSTLDSLLEGFQLISFDWRYLYVNKSLVKQSKLNTRKDMLGFTMMEKFPGIENTELFKVLQECMKTRVSKTMENEFTFPDNSKGCFELRIAPVPKGIFILSMDITERKKSEASFRESEEKYRLFFEHNLDAIFLTATDGSILDANPEAIRLFGYSLKKLRQKGRGAIVDVNDPKLHSALLERKKTGKFRGELILIRKDGIKLLCEISTVIYKNNDGLERTQMIIKDITEKKKAEEKLKQNVQQLEYENEEKEKRAAELAKKVQENIIIDKRLRIQNKKLLEIAFLQSHQVRRPVATLLGLISLFNFNNSTDPMNSEVLLRLKIATNELDNTIAEIVKKTDEIKE